MNKIRNYWKNKKGIALVWGAFFLVLMLMLAGMAVDLGYMYYVRNQLHVASDAAVLAGVAKLDPFTDPTPTQIEARKAAWRFACKNKAAGDPVFLVTNVSADPLNPRNCETPPASGLNESNDPNGDIVVGNWNASRPITPVDLRFLPIPGSALPPGAAINAIKVTSRRTGVTPGMPRVGVFWGQIFRILGGEGWATMSASASAVATMPLRASEYIALCIDACTGCTYPSQPCPLNPEREINKDNCVAGSCGTNAAWTSLLVQPTGPGFNLNELICTTTPDVDVCANPIWTTNGEDAVAQRNLEADMYDPDFDSEAKMCLSSTGVIGKCNEVGGSVQSWTIMVPVTATCPPGAQGTGGGAGVAWDPKPVFGYAIIRVVAVCEQGVGNPCHQELPPNGRQYRAPAGVCDAYANLTIIIDQIQCISCDHIDEILGHKPSLVK